MSDELREVIEGVILLGSLLLGSYVSGRYMQFKVCDGIAYLPYFAIMLGGVVLTVIFNVYVEMKR